MRVLMMKRAEFDVVLLAEDLPEEGLAKGMIGTIVVVFETPTLAYLVCRFLVKDRTIALPALLPDQMSDYLPPERT